MQKRKKKEKTDYQHLTLRLPYSIASSGTSPLRSNVVILSIILLSKIAHRGSANESTCSPCCKWSTYSICMYKKRQNKNTHRTPITTEDMTQLQQKTTTQLLLMTWTIQLLLETWTNCNRKLLNSWYWCHDPSSKFLPREQNVCFGETTTQPENYY